MSVRDALARSINYRWKRILGKMRKSLRYQVPSEVETYLVMKADHHQAEAMYQEGAFWEAINQEFADFLWAGALPHLRNEYFNRRFAGPEPASRQVWRALLWLYYQKLCEIDTDGFLQSAEEPGEGGKADQELINGRPMSLDFLQSVEEVYCVRQAWTQAGYPGLPSLVIELGAGYGRLAYVFQKMMPECTYVVIDLPEALICTSYWLERVLPPGHVVPYTASRCMTGLGRETLLSKKVWVLGAHQLEQIADGAVDAFINIYSFAEMPQSAIVNYFSQINRITRGVFYSKQRKLERNIVDQVTVSEDSYPTYPNWRRLYRRTSTLYEAFFETAYQISEITNR